MSDFAQPGGICTLQRFEDHDLESLEDDRLSALAGQRRIALILPCHARDLLRPALRHIFAELREAGWLSEIIVSVNGACAAELPEKERPWAGARQRVRVLWNDEPARVAAHAALLGCSPAACPQGKGMNVWSALGVLWLEGNVSVAAVQDSDVSTFSRQNLIRLLTPCLWREFGIRFAKMYYSRATGRLHGRVTRLFFMPWLRAALNVSGHGPLLDFLASFRYPLAGEVALEMSLAGKLSLEAGWGLETAMLCEVFRQVELEAICQVGASGEYEHHHQESRALEPMCAEIARTLHTQLAREGHALDLKATAWSTALARERAFAVRRSQALALFNRLEYSQQTEEQAAQAFTGQLPASGAAMMLPAWSDLQQTRPAATAAFQRLAED